MTPARQVRARYDDDTITVYQAYGHAIADAALAAGTFTSPFSRTRMT
jgi:ornithine cyclodeaminase/alanine dehydrogenase-like protein (mu-crystallin family)